MEPESTTETTTPETGVETTQPAEQHAEAVTTTDESTQATTNDAPSGVSDHEEWLANKGIDPSSPEALAKVAEMARNAERAMHEKSQKASDLTKQLEQSPVNADTDNELVQQLFGEVTSMKRMQAVNDFKASSGIDEAKEQQMVSYLEENPQVGQLINAGYLTLPQLKTLALGSNEASIKSEGGKEALQQLANKQRASSLPGNATTSALSGTQGDPFLDALMGKN